MRAQSGCVRQAYGKRRALGQAAADEIDLFTGIRSGLIRESSSAFIGGFDSGKSDISAACLSQQELRRLTVAVEGFLTDLCRALFEPVHDGRDGCAAQVTQTIFLNPATQECQGLLVAARRTERVHPAVVARVMPRFAERQA